MPAPSGVLSPAISRGLPRAPRQLELFRLSRQPRTRAEVTLQESTRSILPPDLAAVAENVVQRVVRQAERRHRADVGMWRRHTGFPVERQLSPEDLRQEALRLIQQRLPKLPTSPSALEAYLYPKVRRAATWQIQTLTQPTRLPKAEQKVLMMEERIRQARERDPRFAALALGRGVSPGEIFLRLAKDPGFAALLRSRGGVRYFGTRSGVERTLEAGSPKAVREAKEAKVLQAGTPSPLDELLAKVGGEEFTGPMARMELALRALTERQREIVTRVLGLGRPQEGIREVARDLKIAHPTVIEHYRAGMKRLQAATKAKPAQAAKPAAEPAPVAPARKTAKELVDERLRQYRERLERRRRWEVEAPIRRMREKPPTREYKPAPAWGEAVLPSDPVRQRSYEDLLRSWELLKRNIRERRGTLPPTGRRP